MNRSEVIAKSAVTAALGTSFSARHNLVFHFISSSRGTDLDRGREIAREIQSLRSSAGPQNNFTWGTDCDLDPRARGDAVGPEQLQQARILIRNTLHDKDPLLMNISQ
jgi:hypothetical protein